jgi:hypothetical protein
VSPHSKTVGLSPTACHNADRASVPVTRTALSAGDRAVPESRGASVPHSLGGTWGGTTTPMRLDAAAPRSLLAVSLRDLCPRCTFRNNCPNHPG